MNPHYTEQVRRDYDRAFKGGFRSPHGLTYNESVLYFLIKHRWWSDDYISDQTAISYTTIQLFRKNYSSLI